MKIKITKDKLYEVIKNYLNGSINPYGISEFDNFIVMYHQDEYDDEFNEVYIEFDDEDGRLYVERAFVDTLTSIFPVNDETAHEFIKKWFEDKFGVNVKYTQS
jgi:hypothetical protein